MIKPNCTIIDLLKMEDESNETWTFLDELADEEDLPHGTGKAIPDLEEIAHNANNSKVIRGIINRELGRIFLVRVK